MNIWSIWEAGWAMVGGACVVDRGCGWTSMLRVDCGCDRFGVGANDVGGNASWGGEVLTSENVEGEFGPPKPGQLRYERGHASIGYRKAASCRKHME